MAEFWKAPRLYPGETIVVLGGGPSLKSLDFSLLRGRRVIAVNCAFRLGKWDACFFGDRAFVQRTAPDLKDWPGLVVTRAEEYLLTPWVKVLKQKIEYRPGNDWPFDVDGITTDPTEICWNRSSGGAAINLAVHFGAGKIILLGFDMQTVDNQHNWHNFYSDNDVQAHTDDYRKFTGPMEAVARDLDKLGIPCINATPGSALGAFPITTPEEALSC